MPATFSDVGGGNWIFVSHSNKDLTEVRGIRNFLETKGHNPILFYLRSLQDDDLLPDLLKREIEARNFFVLCNSPNADRSIWVQEEIRMVKSMPEKIYEEIDLTRDLEGQIHKLAHYQSEQQSTFLTPSRIRRLQAELVEHWLMQTFEF